MNNLEKEFIPYQESLELKELGFDEPCLTYYFSDGAFNDAAEEDNTLYPGDPRFYFDTNSSLAEYCENELKYEAISAPTWYQAFKFFREKYNIKPCFDWHPTEKYRYCIYYSINKYSQKSDFLTHEEAELACVKKLIEIVKNN